MGIFAEMLLGTNFQISGDAADALVYAFLF